MAQLHNSLDSIRRAEAAAARIIDKRVYCGVRYLLLRGKEAIENDLEAKKKLQNLFTLNKTLNIAYILKEEFRQFWKCSSSEEACLYLENWLTKAYASGIRPIIRFAHMMKAHISAVLNYFKYRISTGAIEGINNKRLCSKIANIIYRT